MARALNVPAGVAALVLAAAALLAGCGGSRGAAGDDVSLQVFGAAEELAAYRELVAAYERKGADRMRLIGVPDRDAHLQKIATGFAGGSPPDLFLVNYRNFAGYAARGALDPAGPRLAGSKVLRRAAFYSQPLSAFTYRGTLQCMPQNISSLVVYYNRDLFRKAGLAEPRPGWSYEEFRAAARRLTEPAGKGNEVRRYGVGLEPSIARLAPFVWSAGGDIVDDPDDPRRFTIDTPRGQEGLLAFLDLQGGERLAPFEREVEAKPLDARFLDGELAMFLSSRREVPTFRTIKGLRLGCRGVSAPARAGERPALRRLLPGAGQARRRGVALRRVRGRAGGPADPCPQRSHRALAAVRRALEGLPRSVAAAALEPGLHRCHRDDPAAAAVASTWPELEDAVDLAIKRAYYTELTVDETLARIEEETAPLLERARDAGP